jgi:hypothetical protein
MNDVERLLSIIHECPLPFEKTDSQLAQEYRNWFYGVRSGGMKATEHRLQTDAAKAADVETADNSRRAVEA